MKNKPAGPHPQSLRPDVLWVTCRTIVDQLIVLLDVPPSVLVIPIIKCQHSQAHFTVAMYFVSLIRVRVVLLRSHPVVDPFDSITYRTPSSIPQLQSIVPVSPDSNIFMSSAPWLCPILSCKSCLVNPRGRFAPPPLHHDMSISDCPLLIVHFLIDHSSLAPANALPDEHCTCQLCQRG